MKTLKKVCFYVPADNSQELCLSSFKSFLLLCARAGLFFSYLACKSEATSIIKKRLPWTLFINICKKWYIFLLVSFFSNLFEQMLNLHKTHYLRLDWISLTLLEFMMYVYMFVNCFSQIVSSITRDALLFFVYSQHLGFVFVFFCILFRMEESLSFVVDCTSIQK